jgi:DNA-binding transcriptional MerR regulator
MIDDRPSGASMRPEASEDSANAATDERFLRIDEVARRTNMTKRTLRYYEELQLLDPAQRSEGNYRLYSEADVRTLEHIKQMRDLLGLELKEIREMVAAELERDRLRERWQVDSDPAWRLHALDEVEAVAQRELALLEEKMVGLEHMRQSLRERLERYDRLRVETRAQLDTGASDSDEAPSASRD